MRRIAALVFGLLLALGTASVGLAARPGPSVHQMAMSIATTDVSIACLSADSPCGTVRITLTGASSGQPPFSELKGVKGPQTVIAAFDFPMSQYDSETRCFSGVQSTIAFFVPQGSGSRLAFELDSINGAACGGGFSAAFTLDSDQSEVRTFQGSTGSGTFDLAGDFDLDAMTVSALQLRLTGQMTLTR